MIDFYLANPLWTWMIIAAVLLAVEVATGSGWLLWPAACAAVTGLLTAALAMGLPSEIILFSVLTIVSSLLARKYIPDFRLALGPDINDRTTDLVGKRGRVAGVFIEGVGRVLVDGAEWEAEAEGDLPLGGSVEVVSVLGGARLRVRGA